MIETSPSRDHTERLFNGFGVPVTDKRRSCQSQLDGPARLTGGAITIPGDVSSAAYFVAAAMLLPGSQLTIEGVGLNPTRAAFLSVLSSWGADISTDGFANRTQRAIRNDQRSRRTHRNRERNRTNT